jgi:hypothetical protein
MTKKNQAGVKKDAKSAKEVKDGVVPGTFSKQNLGHNSRKEGMAQSSYLLKK